METSLIALKTAHAPEPLAAPIAEAIRFSGLTRSAIYRGLAVGDIKAVKAGARTLILMDTLRNYVASLPAATFKRPGA